MLEEMWRMKRKQKINQSETISSSDVPSGTIDNLESELLMDFWAYISGHQAFAIMVTLALFLEVSRFPS